MKTKRLKEKNDTKEVTTLHHTLLIIDDHPVVLDGTKTLLQEIPHLTIETELNPGAVAAKIKEIPFDLYLLDVNMKPLNGIQLAQVIKQQQPDAIVIFYTGNEIGDYYDLLFEKKIDGLLSKTAKKVQVIQTIEAALREELLIPVDFLDFVHRKCQLKIETNQLSINDIEKAILQYVAQGLTNKAIAIELKLTQRTIENYLSKLFVRFQVESRIEAVLFARSKGWIS